MARWRRRRAPVPASIFLPSRWRRHRAVWTILALLAAAAVGERAIRTPAQGGDHDRYNDQSFRIVKVVDGDTMDLDVPDGGKPHTRVRLWGVDTPEVAHGGEPEMHFGPEARAFAAHSILGRQVHVMLNPARTRDKYGRLLAYVYLERGGAMFNERLVEQGFAYADSRFDHPYKERFADLERRARRASAGLWAHLKPTDMPKWRQRVEGQAARP